MEIIRISWQEILIVLKQKRGGRSPTDRRSAVTNIIDGTHSRRQVAETRCKISPTIRAAGWRNRGDGCRRRLTTQLNGGNGKRLKDDAARLNAGNQEAAEGRHPPGSLRCGWCKPRATRVPGLTRGRTSGPLRGRGG